METDRRPGLYVEFGSYTEGAYAILKGAIIRSELAPGYKLRIGELCEMTGLGAGPVREALARLSGERLVVSASQRGFWVAPISPAELRQLGRLRNMIEPTAVARAVEFGDPAWRFRVRTAWASFAEETQRVGEVGSLTASWDRSHRDFHMTLLSGTRDAVLLDFAETVYDRFDRYRHLGIRARGHLAGVKDDHAELARCAEMGDVTGAAEIMTRHVEDVASILERNIAWAELTGADRPLADGEAQDRAGS